MKVGFANRFAALALCGALVLVGAACGGDDDDDDTAADAGDATETTTTVADDEIVAEEETTLTQEELDEYVGLTAEEAEAKADDAGLDWRVVSIDGEDQAVTMDFNPNRLNFAVVDGSVTEVTTG